MIYKKILITGKGLIGNRLATFLEEKGHEVFTIDKDIATKPTLCEDLSLGINLFTSFKPDLIIHTAANARVWNSVMYPEYAFENVISMHNIIEYARAKEIPIIFTSSREVYGNINKGLGVSEDMATIKAESPYTASKVYGEALVHAYHTSYDMEYINVRLSNVFGEGETYPKSDRIIPLSIYYAQRNKDITIYNKDKMMNFTYVQDVVEGIKFLIDNWKECKNDTYNICKEGSIKLYDIISFVISNLNSKSRIKVAKGRKGEVENYVGDINKIIEKGWNPKHDVFESLRKVIING